MHPEWSSVFAGHGCEATRVDIHVTLSDVCGSFDKALLAAGRAGDPLVITRLDRLGCSLEHLIDLFNELQTIGVALVVLDQGIDTSTGVDRIFLQILGAIAESNTP